MNLSYLLMSILSGALILLQSSLSGQLSKHTGSPLLSSLALYTAGSLLMAIAIAAFRIKIPSASVLMGVPKYLWVSGSLLSIAGLTIVYWLMPIVGVSKALSGIIAGQILMGMIVSHFGLFELPPVSIDRYRLIGVIFLIAGVVLINGSFGSEAAK